MLVECDRCGFENGNFSGGTFLCGLVVFVCFCFCFFVFLFLFCFCVCLLVYLLLLCCFVCRFLLSFVFFLTWRQLPKEQPSGERKDPI